MKIDYKFIFKKTCILKLSIFFIGCTNTEEVDSSILKFRIPQVIQEGTKNKIDTFQLNFLHHSKFKFFGKYKFSDTLLLKNEFKRDSLFEKDLTFERSQPRKNDSLSTDGLQFISDYKTNLHAFDSFNQTCLFTFFPIYVVNETSSTKLFYTKDYRIDGIQEAEDTSDYMGWRPIEYRVRDFCGNGWLEVKIHPGEYVLFLAPKYKGNEKGLMRIRIENGESLYITKSFIGNYNPNQFHFYKEKEFLLDKKMVSRFKNDFYGSLPKALESIE